MCWDSFQHCKNVWEGKYDTIKHKSSPLDSMLFLNCLYYGSIEVLFKYDSNINYIHLYYFRSIWVFTPVLNAIFQWRMSDSNPPLISSFSSLCPGLRTILRALYIIGITIMFQSFFNSIKIKVFFISFFTLWSAGMAKSTGWKILFFW